jgi:hypothetical protein
MELNLTYHLHCIVGFIINCDQSFIWVGIHLHLVIANNILTKLLKVMLSLNHAFYVHQISTTKFHSVISQRYFFCQRDMGYMEKC